MLNGVVINLLLSEGRKLMKESTKHGVHCKGDNIEIGWQVSGNNTLYPNLSDTIQEIHPMKL